MGRVRFRKRPGFGPFRVNITEGGVRSISLKLGPFSIPLTGRRGPTVSLGGGLRYEADSRKDDQS